jgi:hypothetical protein
LAWFIAISLLGAAVPTLGQGKRITSRAAKRHVGQQATVCGRVASWRRTSEQGNPTFLDFDKTYPDQSFSVVIWARYHTRFRDPEDYRNKNICVTGQIGSHRGHPEMIISDPSQLTAETFAAEVFAPAYRGPSTLGHGPR